MPGGDLRSEGGVKETLHHKNPRCGSICKFSACRLPVVSSLAPLFVAPRTWAALAASRGHVDESQPPLQEKSGHSVPKKVHFGKEVTWGATPLCRPAPHTPLSPPAPPTCAHCCSG